METCNDMRMKMLTGGDAAEHLAACADCRAWLAVDARVKAVPAPPTAATSQAAFLKTLSTTVSTPRRRSSNVFAWATAAAVFLAIGVGTVLLSPMRQVEAKTSVVDALVEWNLQLSETGELADRGRLHQQKQPELRRAVMDANLPPRELAVANQLLDHGEWLARNDDPLDSAERFQVIADAMLDIAEVSPKSEDIVVAATKLAHRGVKPNVAKSAPKGNDAVKAQRIANRQAKQEAKLDALAAKLSEANRDKVKKTKSAKRPG